MIDASQAFCEICEISLPQWLNRHFCIRRGGLAWCTPRMRFLFFSDRNLLSFTSWIHVFSTPVAQVSMSDFILGWVRFFSSPESSFCMAKTWSFNLLRKIALGTRCGLGKQQRTVFLVFVLRQKSLSFFLGTSIEFAPLLTITSCASLLPSPIAIGSRIFLPSVH